MFASGGFDPFHYELEPWRRPRAAEPARTVLESGRALIRRYQTEPALIAKAPGAPTYSQLMALLNAPPTPANSSLSSAGSSTDHSPELQLADLISPGRSSAAESGPDSGEQLQPATLGFSPAASLQALMLSDSPPSSPARPPPDFLSPTPAAPTSAKPADASAPAPAPKDSVPTGAGAPTTPGVTGPTSMTTPVRSVGRTPKRPVESAEELERRRIAKMKTSMCHELLLSGVCPYGPDCRFAHSPDELRPMEVSAFGRAQVRPRSLQVHENYKTKPCRNFMTYGRCAYGKKCQFLHGSDIEQLLMSMLKLQPGQIPSTHDRY